MDFDGLCDPYVKVDTGLMQWDSNVIKGTLPGASPPAPGFLLIFSNSFPPVSQALALIPSYI